MTRSDSHECGACGGTGNLRNDYPDLAACRVCLGAGRISDRMPVADALADAETLRLGVRAHFYGDDFLTGTRDAGRCGQIAANWTRANESEAHSWAMSAARAAFRAVPGLIGE